MKILYISQSTIPSRMANSIHVMKMCQAFANNGHEVTLLAPNVKNQYEKNINDIYEYYGVKKNFVIKKLFYPNNKIAFMFYTLAIFFYLLFNKKFDLVYGRFLYGCYIATILKNKVIFESHKPISGKIGKKILEKLNKNKYLKKIVVISQALKNIYLENKCLDSFKIQVAHDGADEVTNFKNKINLLGNKNYLKVGYIGHLYKGKGMEVIDSLSNKISSDIEIHIIGGHEKDIEYWKKKIVFKNIFFYGFVPHKEVGSYINALDICLLPNQREVYTQDKIESDFNISGFTSPLKLFEYMSYKKPIIASDIPVLREVLNEKNSILVKYDDIEAWINSIEALKDPKKREEIASQALCDFKFYTWRNRANLVK